MFDKKKYAHESYIAHKEGRFKKKPRPRFFDRKKWAREYYLTHKDMWREKDLRFKTRHPHYRQELRLSYKIDTLTHYGGGVLACIQCGENRLAALSLDHINNNGNEHRRQLGNKKNYIYRLLKNDGYPNGYQTLCFNCQIVKKIQIENNRSHY